MQLQKNYSLHRSAWNCYKFMEYMLLYFVPLAGMLTHLLLSSIILKLTLPEVQWSWETSKFKQVIA